MTKIEKTQCYGCSESFKDSELSTLNQESFCDSCRPEYTSCYNCDGITHEDDTLFVDDEAYCSTCHSELFFNCSYCGYDTATSDEIYCETCDSSYCYDCNINNHDCEDNSINTRKYSTSFFKGTESGKTIKIDRFVGVELESENGESSGLVLPAEIGLSRDGSLNDSGIEIQTPPASLNKLEYYISESCKRLTDSGYEATKRCGLHVHVDARDFKNDCKKISHVLQTFYAIEDMIFSMLPPSRWDSHYCKNLFHDYMYKDFMKSDLKKLESVIYKTQDSNLIDDKKGDRYSNERYHGVNIHSLFYRGTIEFRYHSGTLDKVKILSWIDFLLHVVDWAINNYDKKIVSQLYNLKTSKQKAEKIKEVFNLSDDTYSYMMTRWQKFNPDFKVIFNKGRYSKGINVKKLQKELDKLTDEIEKKYNEVSILFEGGSDLSGNSSQRRYIELKLSKLIDKRYKLQMRINGSPLNKKFISKRKLTAYISKLQ